MDLIQYIQNQSRPKQVCIKFEKTLTILQNHIAQAKPKA